MPDYGVSGEKNGGIGYDYKWGKLTIRV